MKYDETDVNFRIFYHWYLRDINKYGQTSPEDSKSKFNLERKISPYQVAMDYNTLTFRFPRNDYYFVPKKILEKKALENNFIKKATIPFVVKQHKVKDIKSFLKDHNLKVSGRKSELVERVVNNFDEDYLREFFNEDLFELTDDGLKYLEDNKHLALCYWMGNNVFTEIITVSEYEEKLGSFDALKEYIEKVTLKEDIAIDDWENYFRHMHFLFRLYIQDEDYLPLLKISLKEYLARVNLLEFYKKRKYAYFSSPKYIGSIKSCMENLSLSNKDLEILFDEAHSTFKSSRMYIPKEIAFEYLTKYCKSYPHVQQIDYEFKHIIDEYVPWFHSKKYAHEEVLERDNFCCTNCGISSKETHLMVIPKNMDFKNSKSNVDDLVTLCHKCIEEKHEQKNSEKLK